MKADKRKLCLRFAPAVALIALWLCVGQPVSVLATDSVAIAGVVEPVSDSSLQLATYFLRSARTGDIVAGLLDPLQLISETPARLILQTERLATRDVNGLPLFSITGIAPEFWVQPVSFGLLEKGPGGFAAVSSVVRPEDWTGVPLEDLRATWLDGGLDEDELPVALSNGFDPSTEMPLDLADAVFDGRSLKLSWPGVAGVIYQVLFATDPQGPYTVLREVGAAESGPISLSVGTAGQTGFFKLAVVQPTN